VTLSDDDRSRQVGYLLNDDMLRPYTRVAGLFTLLFAQPLVRIRRMLTEQVTLHPDGWVLVRFKTVQVEMPAHVGPVVA
jgi:hypothetical protein